MSKVSRKANKVADFFAFSKFGLPVFALLMLLVFGVGGGFLVAALK